MAPVQEASVVPAANNEVELTEQIAVADIRQEIMEEFAAFFRANHEKAIAFAKAILKDENEAQDVVARTYLKLLRGKTGVRHFFRSLKQTCLDRIRELKREGKLFTSIKESVSPKFVSLSEVAWGPEGIDTVSIEPVSHYKDDRNPLDILVHKEEIEDGIRRVRTTSRHRWIKQLQWWDALTGEQSVTVKA